MGPESVPVAIPAGRLAFLLDKIQMQEVNKTTTQSDDLRDVEGQTLKEVEYKWDSWCYEVL